MLHELPGEKYLHMHHVINSGSLSINHHNNNLVRSIDNRLTHPGSICRRLSLDASNRVLEYTNIYYDWSWLSTAPRVCAFSETGNVTPLIVIDHTSFDRSEMRRTPAVWMRIAHCRHQSAPDARTMLQILEVHMIQHDGVTFMRIKFGACHNAGIYTREGGGDLLAIVHFVLISLSRLAEILQLR